MKAQEIIQEALEIGFKKEPTSFFEKLFYVPPPHSKVKSSAIMYLTNRLMQEQQRAREAERHAEERIRYANRELAKYNIRL